MEEQLEKKNIEFSLDADESDKTTEEFNLSNEDPDVDSKKIDKLFYSISEVAQMFNVNASLIRYWEKEFPIIKPKKNKKGNRLFTKEDIENFHIIYHLVKERGMTLSGAKKKLKENKEDTLNNFGVVKMLKDIRQMLLEIRDSI
jgi:DNA-binding transcriptional MerR regulator